MGHMGHITEGTNKKEVEKSLLAWSKRNYDREETSHGLYGIEWQNKLFDSYEEAEKYLKNLVGKNHYWRCMGAGCKYIDFKKQPKIPKKITSLLDKSNEYRKKCNEINFFDHFKEVKQKTIKCKKCGTIIPLGDGRNHNHCPNCNFDMRPQTILNKIMTYYKKSEEYSKQYEKELKDFYAERKKNKQNTIEKYIAYGEIHC